MKTLFGFRGQGRFRIEDWPDPQIGALCERSNQVSSALLDQNWNEKALRFGIAILVNVRA